MNLSRPNYLLLITLVVILGWSHRLSAAEQTSPSSFSISTSDTSIGSPDWRGLTGDTAYFIGWQFVAVAALYRAPERITSWSPEDKKAVTTAKWRRNISKAVWDHDDWVINNVLHPYWGATYYIRARERGLDRTQSFLTSALWSAIFECGPEAFFEPVSKQDLIITPVTGMLLGEFVFTPLREQILASTDEPKGWGKAALVVTDPFYYLNTWVDELVGVKTTMRVQLIPAAHFASSDTASSTSGMAWRVSLHTAW
ncbi:MAG: DUF3943 domain-containing protein [Gallionella sp.]|nr:DUF3943 domain-containing protein [Gallionella sp.]